MTDQTPASAETPDAPVAGSLHDRVQHLLDLMRPAIQSDGGDLELVEVRDGGVVLVRFHGACVGCPSSGITLQAGIERRLKERLPEVTSVESVS
ncbi:MAG: NifU family protein [Planctomycetota bacterium]|jgi:Fe-S cluster biogenesis protein NfuA